MKFENVQGIIWDLDGTLIDSESLFVGVLQDVVAELGYEMPTEEVIARNYHGSLRDTFSTILNVYADEELDKITEVFTQKQNELYAEDNTDSHFFEDAVHLAQQAALQNIPQFIVTNRNHEGHGTGSPHSIIAASVLAHCIDVVKCGDEVVERKPNSRVIEGWFDQHNVAEKDILIIGDQYVDAQLALNIGARALLIARNGNTPHFETVTNQAGVSVVDSLHDVTISK